MRGQQTLERNLRLADALLIPFDSRRQRRLKIIPRHAESGSLGLRKVIGARFAGQVGVVECERLFGFQTSLKQDAFPIPRLEHVEIDAYVRGKETLLNESGFAGGLDADKNISISYLLHRQLSFSVHSHVISQENLVEGILTHLEFSDCGLQSHIANPSDA